ncbi:MAG TPA: asparagine synthetase A [Thermoplasmataceae archaeon]|nr:asparagine synthetase A [Thermoplasmatales archaeon AK]HLH85546.1 asparagine synthetase A [Thermoplasmataceae archaeon]
MEYEIVNELWEHLSNTKLETALKIHSHVRLMASEFLQERGFLEVPPVIFSTVTDPLNHPVYDPSFEYDGTRYALTKSMIFHKQMLVKRFPKIYTFSPNVRLELPEKASTGRHLLEFTQLDLEVRGARREDVMDLGEDLLISILRSVKKTFSDELKQIGRDLRIPEKPFKRIRYLDAESEYGSEFESALSRKERSPFWIIDIPLDKREFYDLEKAEEPGILRDMDLIYPEGYQEALSGGEREYDLSRIKERIRKKNQTEDQFRWFLEFAKMGLDPSAGFGIGIERLVRYICGYSRIELVHPFPKVPGKVSI